MENHVGALATQLRGSARPTGQLATRYWPEPAMMIAAIRRLRVANPHAN
jgi:hypothetical protein